MRIVIGVLAIAAACGDDGMFPVGGNGNDGGLTFPDSPRSDSSVSGDAATDAVASAVDANFFNGRVCLAADPRKLNTCASSGAGGLTVRLGTAVTTTADNGSFTISGQAGANLVWRVTGTNIVSSYMMVGDYEIPAISRTTYTAMVNNNLGGLQLNPGEGSLMVQVIQNGVGRNNAFGQSDPISSWQAFYDGADLTPTTFQQTSTGTNGMVWFAGLDVGAATAKVVFGDEIAKGPLPIFDGGITFTTIIFP